MLTETSEAKSSAPWIENTSNTCPIEQPLYEVELVYNPEGELVTIETQCPWVFEWHSDARPYVKRWRLVRS